MKDEMINRQFGRLFVKLGIIKMFIPTWDELTKEECSDFEIFCVGARSSKL